MQQKKFKRKIWEIECYYPVSFFMKRGMMLSWEEKVISSNDQSNIRTDKELTFVASSDSRFFISREP